MDTAAAIAHLRAAGITPEVLGAQGVDPDDPQALLALVDREIRGITDGDSLAEDAEYVALCAAREALLPASEEEWRRELAARIVADLDKTMPACEQAA